MVERILVTGGAGFVGSNIAIAFKRDRPAASVVAFDNLKRRGSELGIARLRANGVEFTHGDVRVPADLAAIGPIDLIVEASAESSVHAGYDGDPNYLIYTNLLGAANCLEHARRHDSVFVFLSSSRVYPIAPLRILPLVRTPTRFVLREDISVPGVSPAGISEQFTLSGNRSLYGATKLSAELLVEEYKAIYGVRALINRCGVLSGPWQMGKVDQGFVVLWMARHLFGGRLTYTGFGGEGLQVRDILHIDDLYDLLVQQLTNLDRSGVQTSCNVGGGIENSVSVSELTALCQEISGKHVEIGSILETRDADIPFYVSDCSLLTKGVNWAPRRSLRVILEDIARWLVDNRRQLEPVLN